MKKLYVLLLMLFAIGFGMAHASGPCPAKFPVTRADGSTPGTAVQGGRLYYFEDADISGFQCFQRLSSWFPSYITSSAGSSPDRVTVDMAYTYDGTADFHNVVVPQNGIYTLTFRYAFEPGLFPGLDFRPEGITVNGTSVTTDIDFPQTGSFETFKTLAFTVELKAGVNDIQLVNQATQSVSRMDWMMVTPGGAPNACMQAPAVPANFTAAENANNAIALSWTPSVVPAECHVGYYNVYRETMPNFTPTEDNEVATVVGANTFADTTATCNKTYYYIVEALDLAGSSSASGTLPAKVSQCPTVSSAQIDAGGPAEAPYLSDVDFSGGSAKTNTAVVSLANVVNPAPAAVYQTMREGSFSYTLGGFVPGSTHTLRLHFVEPYFTSKGQRTFNITVGTAVLMSGYDIFASAGAKNKAVVLEHSVTADASGNIVIGFTQGRDQPLVNAVEVK